MSPSCVYVIGTFDTKREELGYVANLIMAQGVPVITVDVGTSTMTSDGTTHTAQEIAGFHPDGANAVFDSGDRGKAVIAMSEALVHFLSSRQDVAGVIALGGSGGTSLIAPALRALPLGVPKVMVSTVASGDTSGYVGVSDITMMFPVTDIAGLNAVSRTILANAANAIAGMAKGRTAETVDARPALALSMFGVTTTAIRNLRDRLKNDYDCIVFHANGAGGKALEAIADSGMVKAVIDITTTETADHLMGGICSAGPERFDVLARTGIPWIGSCGALDMVNFGPRETVPSKYQDRHFHIHNANITLMRTTPEENVSMARWLVGKLNASTGPVDLVLPLRGVSALDAPGQAFWDPEADKALFETIEAEFTQSKQHRLHAVDLHINDSAFADYIKELLTRNLN